MVQSRSDGLQPSGFQVRRGIGFRSPGGLCEDLDIAVLVPILDKEPGAYKSRSAVSRSEAVSSAWRSQAEVE